jgi:hypothetical protein
MPKGDNKPWPWDDLEAEWLTSRSKDFPFVTDFLRFKGIPENTGYKHTKGWQHKRDLIYQRAAAKAISRYESNVSKVIERQGIVAEAIIQTSFQNMLECDKKGNPLVPLKFKKGFKPSPAIIQRLLMQSMGIQQRLAGVEGNMAGKISDQAPMKVGGESEDAATPQDSQKLKLIRQSPKLLEAAEKLLDALGPDAEVEYQGP